MPRWRLTYSFVSRPILMTRFIFLCLAKFCSTLSRRFAQTRLPDSSSSFVFAPLEMRSLRSFSNSTVGFLSLIFRRAVSGVSFDSSVRGSVSVITAFFRLQLTPSSRSTRAAGKFTASTATCRGHRPSNSSSGLPPPSTNACMIAAICSSVPFVFLATICMRGLSTPRAFRSSASLSTCIRPFGLCMAFVCDFSSAAALTASHLLTPLTFPSSKWGSTSSFNRDWLVPISE